jgi:hypothetical protein
MIAMITCIGTIIVVIIGTIDCTPRINDTIHGGIEGIGRNSGDMIVRFTVTNGTIDHVWILTFGDIIRTTENDPNRNSNKCGSD